MVRDSLVSLLSTAVSQSVLAVAFGAALDGPAGQRRRLRGGRVPAFHLNRSWAWGRRGRSHLLREVVSFGRSPSLGLAFSTWAADFGSTMAHRAAPRMRRPQPS